MAPEVILMPDSDCRTDDDIDNYGQKADIWSLGATLCFMCKKEVPFTRSVLYPLIDPDNTDPLPHVEIRRDLYTLELQDFMNRCLSKFPNERPSAQEILRHPLIAPSVLTVL